MIVSNFKGKEILDSLHKLKIEYDSEYFNRQTYREFLVDPLGAKLIDAWAETDDSVKKNVHIQERLVKAMNGVAQVSSVPIDLKAPSKKRQAYLEEEEMRKKMADTQRDEFSTISNNEAGFNE